MPKIFWLPRSFSPKIVANALHIDTVQLSHAYRAVDLPPPEELVKLGFDVDYKIRDYGNFIAANSKLIKKLSYEPHLKITRKEVGYCGVNVKLSIAKLLDRSGLEAQSNGDIECALDAVENFVRQRLSIKFDAKTAKVHRFDANADFLVGEYRINAYKNSLSRPYSRLTPSTFGSTSAYYFNDSRGFAVYGKKEEMEKEFRKGKVTYEDVERAEGLLRVESRLKNNQAVKRFAKKLSIPAEAGYLLNLQVASKFVADTLSLLDLDKPKASNDMLMALLLERCGSDATELLGILEYRKFYGEDCWKVLGISKQTFNKKKKKLEDADLWSVSPTIALPALAI